MTDPQRRSRQGDLIRTDVRGVHASGAAFEALVRRLDDGLLRAVAHEQPEVLQLPPVMSRATFEKAGYFRNFPHLSATVHAFTGDERDHTAATLAMDRGEDWTGAQRATDLVLTPAACYPVYPILAARGPVPPAGVTVSVSSYCFRREPSDDPARMQSFRMREFVYAGSPEAADDFRARWMTRAEDFMRTLDVPARMEPAHDPFFGRVAVIKSKGQLTRGLKHELTAATDAAGAESACASFNLHLSHFADAFGLRGEDGEPVHTACVGFGLERLALAAIARHGAAPDPSPTRAPV